jgi:hypothetical protein
MKSTNPNKNILGGIIVLILIGVVFGYYVTHREVEKLPTTPSVNRRSENDSAVRPDRERIPAGMGLKPEKDPKNGSVKIVKEFIKLNAKNPATFEFLEWSEVSTEGRHWKVRCKYRGISSFNAEVTTNAWFYIQNNKVVRTRVISKI